jgi:hypothetical protein
VLTDSNFLFQAPLVFVTACLTGQSLYCGGWKLLLPFISGLQLQTLGFDDPAAYK